FEAARDRTRVAGLGALEHHVLDEMRDAEALGGLVTRAIAAPGAERHRVAMRHGERAERDPRRKHGLLERVVEHGFRLQTASRRLPCHSPHFRMHEDDRLAAAPPVAVTAAPVTTIAATPIAPVTAVLAATGRSRNAAFRLG